MNVRRPQRLPLGDVLAVPSSPNPEAPASRVGVPPEQSPPRARGGRGICLVGPMLGRNPGFVTSQGEILGDALSAAGYDVHAASSAPGRVRRLVEIVAAVLRHRPNARVLVVETYGGLSFLVEDAATAIGRLLGYRIVVHLHGGAMPTFMQRFPRWTRRVLARADAIVAPSPYLARAMVTVGRRAVVIPNVVETSGYTFRHRRRVRPRLFWMRSFHPIYNPLLALRVLARLRERFPDATLVLAGQDKGLEQTVKDTAAQLGLGDAVRFPGFLNLAAKQREADAADVFLCTNRIDNAPVAVLEAAALGLPVVATDVGGLRDLLRDGTCGLLVPDDDAEAMAAAVARLVDEPPLAERLSDAGRQLASSSAWSAVGPQWDALLAALLAPATRRAASHRQLDTTFSGGPH